MKRNWHAKLGISRKCLWERRQRFGIPRQKQNQPEYFAFGENL